MASHLVLSYILLQLEHFAVTRHAHRRFGRVRVQTRWIRSSLDFANSYVRSIGRWNGRTARGTVALGIEGRPSVRFVSRERSAQYGLRPNVGVPPRADPRWAESLPDPQVASNGGAPQREPDCGRARSPLHDGPASPEPASAGQHPRRES